MAARAWGNRGGGEVKEKKKALFSKQEDKRATSHRSELG